MYNWRKGGPGPAFQDIAESYEPCMPFMLAHDFGSEELDPRPETPYRRQTKRLDDWQPSSKVKSLVNNLLKDQSNQQDGLLKRYVPIATKIYLKVC
jgi:hypothetical protein